MKRVGLFVLGLVVLSGCRTAHDVAVSSFHVLDAPANYVRRHIDGDTQRTTTTTTTASSDAVTTPGRNVTPSATITERRTTTTAKPSASQSPPSTVTEKTKPSPGPSRNASTQSQIPTAKPVPGKPGYVFSPFDPSGGYVDVTGYASGQKVKDPYSGKIFLVP
ncbi:MAG: hypothetical protein ABR611_06625 [Chthoniobacterales bacterium]